MTTQLWMWEYQGQTEFGNITESFAWTSSYSFGRNQRREKNLVTNLRPAKVVDEDAAVIKGASEAELSLMLSFAAVDASRQGRDSKYVARMAMLAAQFDPPVLEPTGFGAIVEAQLDGRHGISSFPVAQRKHLWKLEGFDWKLINGAGLNALWCWFIDPVVISEGVTK